MEMEPWIDQSHAQRTCSLLMHPRRAFRDLVVSTFFFLPVQRENGGLHTVLPSERSAKTFRSAEETLGGWLLARRSLTGESLFGGAGTTRKSLMVDHVFGRQVARKTRCLVRQILLGSEPQGLSFGVAKIAGSRGCAGGPCGPPISNFCAWPSVGFGWFLHISQLYNTYG
jgi:hypothetical protein